MEDEIIELRFLLKDVIETLDGKDDSVKEWIKERLSTIKSSTEF